MRWAVIAVFFIIACFGFFIGFSVSSLLLSEVGDALTPIASSETVDIILLLKTAFGVICALAFGLLFIIFGLESLSDEPETYWRQP